MARLYGFKDMEAECFVEPIRAGIAARFKGRFILLFSCAFVAVSAAKNGS